MALPITRQAYTDCETIFERADATAHGIRIRCPQGYGQANLLRMRMHKCRSIIREDNSRTYELGHPMHGCSVYDPFTVRIREDHGQWFMYVERTEMPSEDLIEVLDSANEAAKLPSQPLLLDGPTIDGEYTEVPPVRQITVRRV